MKKQNWDFKKIALKDLILWDNNPRTFDKNSPNPNQKEIISRYQADKLLRIVKNILKYQKNDLQPGELTVVQKGKKFVVFDGNRRISAYKVLLNPELATDRRDKFAEFSKQLSFTDKKQLWFNIAPDIKSALSRIDDLHNDNFHENWNPTAKTNFALLNIDGQIKELKQKKTHLKRDSLYKKIKSFTYSENIKNIINNPNKFKITSLERIVDSSIGKEYLNYDFNEKGEIVIKGDEKKFDQVLKKVAEDIALGDADSRKQHDNEQKETYFKNVFKVLGLNKEEGTIKSISSDKDAKKGQEGTTAKKDWITHDEYLFYKGADKVKQLLKEMKDLDPSSSRITAVISLRVLLESSLYFQLEDKKHIAKIEKEYKNKLKIENTERVKKSKPIILAKQNWSPSFREMLDYITEESNLVIKDSHSRDALSSVIKGEKNFVEDLNKFIHNVQYIPKKDDAEKTWSQFGRLLFGIISKIEL